MNAQNMHTGFLSCGDKTEFQGLRVADLDGKLVFNLRVVKYFEYHP